MQLRSWLLAVARNAAIDQLRAESPYVAMTDQRAESCGVSPCPQDAAVMNELIADLAPALTSLNSRVRTVIELRYFDGLSFRAIADQTGDGLETVKTHARLGIQQLRRALG